MNSSKKLNAIINHSIENSNYYRNMMGKDEDSDISLFPILDKKKLCDFKNDIIIDEYKNTLLKECSIHLSSGTVGRPIEVYWHYDDEMISNLNLWRLRSKYHGITPSSRLCTPFSPQPKSLPATTATSISTRSSTPACSTSTRWPPRQPG